MKILWNVHTENQTQRWQPTIQPADSKKSANSSSTEGERWTSKDGRNWHHRADTRANRLVCRYCDSTKERRWGADLHWLQKAERCNQAWKICHTDCWRHPSQTEGIHHLYQAGCHEWILANSTGRWISQTHYIHQSIWPILLPQITTGHYVCARDFLAHRGRDHCRRGACCVFLRWHPGVQWRRRSSRKTLEDTMEKLKHQAEQREVSVSSAGDWLFGLCHQQRWRENRPKENRGNPRNAWPHQRCRDTPFSRYGQLPRSDGPTFRICLQFFSQSQNS